MECRAGAALVHSGICGRAAEVGAAHKAVRTSATARSRRCTRSRRGMTYMLTVRSCAVPAVLAADALEGPGSSGLQPHSIQVPACRHMPERCCTRTRDCQRRRRSGWTRIGTLSVHCRARSKTGWWRHIVSPTGLQHKSPSIAKHLLLRRCAPYCARRPCQPQLACAQCSRVLSFRLALRSGMAQQSCRMPLCITDRQECAVNRRAALALV